MTGPKSPPEQRWPVLAVCLVLAAMTFAVFGQTLTHGFIDFDDDEYVYDNPVVSQGLTLRGLRWAFSFHANNWHPLTWISHMLDCQIYGLHTGGHHLTNVLLHTATVIALFLVLRRMTGTFWQSAFVAAVFAIHPLRVESVAWVAERKDVLSGLFFVLTLGAYVRYARLPLSLARYGVVVLLFGLGLMCKPMLVTLPLVLLLLDYWPLRRSESVSRLFVEKLPLLAMSAATCLATVLAQTGAIESTQFFSLPVRVGNALVTCVVYLRQMVYPAGLAVFYPYSSNGVAVWEILGALGLLLAITVFAWMQRGKQPWMLTGWLWYLVMLLPVLGIVQVGRQAHADRYTYLPQIGIYMALTWWVGSLRLGRAARGGIMAAALGALMICAWKQTAYWQDNETLWTHAVECTSNNDVAHYKLGNALRKKGSADEAIAQYEHALRFNPIFTQAHNNLGVLLMQKHDVDEAISHFQTALQIKPDYADAHYNLGKALLQKGNLADAIAHFQSAVQIKPDYTDAHIELGEAFLQEGKVNDAIAQFQTVLSINPHSAEGHSNLGIAFSEEGQLDNAIAEFEAALQINPELGQANFNLGVALLLKGKASQAMAYLEKAVQINPRNGAAYFNLGNAFLEQGNVPEAIKEFEKAIQLENANPVVKNNLSWLLATCADPALRNGARAVDLAQKANVLTGGENPMVLNTLAAALAENGRFPEAMDRAQHALRLAEAQSNAGLVRQLEYEMTLFKAGKPFHSPAQTP